MQKPNILLIMTDQQRADFFLREGFALDTMPFLEYLSQDGCWFERAYTSEPICIPARVSLLTGRYPKATGVVANWEPRPNYVTDLPELLGAAGYERALFGKNHSHLSAQKMDVWCEYSHTWGPQRTPEDTAFDAWMERLGHWVAHEATPFPVEAQYPSRIVSDFIAWLQARDEQRPFFAWVSFPEPHSPYQVPEPYFSLFPLDEIPPPGVAKDALRAKNHQWRYQYEAIKAFHPGLDDIWPRYRANYCGMLRLIDDQLERLFAALEQENVLQDTLIVYLSDHGDFCGDYGLYRKGLALPECTIRIPLMFRGPGITSDVIKDSYVSCTDVFPTLCELAGLSIPFGVQGRSLLPILKGEEYSQKEFQSVYVELGMGGKAITAEQAAQPEFKVGEGEVVIVDGQAVTNFDGLRVSQFGRRRAVLKGGYKLIYDQDVSPELYDLEQDPLELKNLAGDTAYREILRQMMEELLWWSIRLDDNLDAQRFRYVPPSLPHNWVR